MGDDISCSTIYGHEEHLADRVGLREQLAVIRIPTHDQLVSDLLVGEARVPKCHVRNDMMRLQRTP